MEVETISPLVLHVHCASTLCITDVGEQMHDTIHSARMQTPFTSVDA
jgi:hypothetical protein